MLACDAKNRLFFLRSSDAKCLRFGLSLRFGLRCERPRCQIASDAGRAMRTTKPTQIKSPPKIKNQGRANHEVQTVWVARLQSEVCTKDIFRATKIVTKNAPKIPPKSLFEPLFCGSEKSREIPAKCPAKFPSQKLKNFTDELLQARRENKL